MKPSGDSVSSARAWGFLAPLLIVFTLFVAWPLGRSLVLSFHRTLGVQVESFVGLGNYRFLLQDPYFWFAVANTAAFALAFVSIQIPVSLGLALLLNRPRLAGRNLLRFAFVSTHLVGNVFVAIIFSVLLAPRDGLINRGLSALLGQTLQIHWLGSPRLAMLSVLIAALWLSIGLGMVYYLAALKSIDPDLYAAAASDGAGPWSRFWHITLPGVRPVTRFMLLIGLIGAFQLFELPYVLFGQSAGPGGSALTIVMYLFATGFQAGDLGFASAVGWMMVLLVAAISLLGWRSTGALRSNA